MGKVIAFSNQKGGSGKSTLSANIAVLWSNSGYKVAVIDADAQKSLTYWLEARKKYYGEDDIGLTQYDFDIKNLIDEVKKIINPLTFAPENPGDGDRYLNIDTLADSTATVQSSTWGSLVESVDDIIQYSMAESKWIKLFDASHPDSTLHYVTNSHTGIQYRFTGTEWVKSYEGIYGKL